MSDPQQLPASQRVNRPESGTYGEGADLDRLQQSFPDQPSAAPAPDEQRRRPQPVGTPQGSPIQQRQSPSSLPDAIMHPGSGAGPQPEAPMAVGPSPAMQLSGSQRRLQVLDMLAENPDVSEDTREWAQQVRRVLIGG